MRQTTLAITVVALISAATASSAASQDSSPIGNLDAGRSLAVETCAACHGLDGVSRLPGAPHLAGQHAGYLLTALTAYREGRRAGPAMAVMAEVVTELGEADMVNVAAYFASLVPFTRAAANSAAPTTTDPTEALDSYVAGKAVAEACAGCHGEDGNSEIPGMPGLAGQHADYLVAALEAYRDGSRTDDVMQSFAQLLDDIAMQDVARYYAALTPKPAAAPGIGDPYAGRTPAAACAGCHGEDGNSRKPDMPRLAGLDAEFLVTAIKAYKDGSRVHDVMLEPVAKLSDSDIANLAAYYATKAPKAAPVLKPLTIRQWAEKCDRCHGPDGNSVDPKVPILAGQSEQYLAEALKLYHSKLRDSSMMYAMSFPMAETDIRKLAVYYARKTVE